jgi:hypothetical protein
MVYKWFVDSAQEGEYMALPAETCQPTFEPTCQPAVSVKLNSTVQIWLDSINLHPLRFCIPLLGHLDEDCKCYFTQMKLSGILKRMFCERWSKVGSIAPCRGHQLCRANFNGSMWDCCLLCGLSSYYCRFLRQVTCSLSFHLSWTNAISSRLQWGSGWCIGIRHGQLCQT